MNGVLLVACVVFQWGAEPEAQTDDPDLQGTWIALDRNPWKNDQPDPSAVGRRLTFDAGRFTIADPDGKLLYSGTYQIEDPVTTDRGTSAMGIRFVHTAGLAQGQTWLGIYGTCPSLRITDNSSDPSKPRPPHYHPQDRQGYSSVGYSRTGKY